MKEREEDIFYIGIKDPTDLRKNILEASKAMIQTLQRLEKLKTIKAKKQNKTHMLKEAIRDINKINAKIRLAIPKTKLMDETLKKEAPKKIEVREISRVVAQRQPESRNELEKLDDELRLIEEKLSRVS